MPAGQQTSRERRGGRGNASPLLGGGHPGPSRACRWHARPGGYVLLTSNLELVCSELVTLPSGRAGRRLLPSPIGDPTHGSLPVPSRGRSILLLTSEKGAFHARPPRIVARGILAVRHAPRVAFPDDEPGSRFTQWPIIPLSSSTSCLVAAIVAVIVAISGLLSPSDPSPAKGRPYECGVSGARQRRAPLARALRTGGHALPGVRRRGALFLSLGGAGPRASLERHSRHRQLLRGAWRRVHLRALPWCPEVAVASRMAARASRSRLAVRR